MDDGQEDKLDAESKAIWEKYLPLNERSKVKSKEEGGEDASSERQQSSHIKLFSCREEDGTLRIQEVKPGPLSRKDLLTDVSQFVINSSFYVFIQTRNYHSSACLCFCSHFESVL